MKSRAPIKARLENTVLDSVSRPRNLLPITPAELERVTWNALPSVPDSPSGKQNPLDLEAKKQVMR